jgi:hypothetical protein
MMSGSDFFGVLMHVNTKIWHQGVADKWTGFGKKTIRQRGASQKHSAKALVSRSTSSFRRQGFPQIEAMGLEDTR